MTRRKLRRVPVLGPAFDCDRMNAAERVRAYVNELAWYRPRGFSTLMREGERIARAIDRDEPDAHQSAADWYPEAEEMLTAWARKRERHDFITFGPAEHSGDVGFWIDAEACRAESDLTLDAGECVPRGFSGTAVFVTDHGNMTAQTFSRGRMCRELFSVV